MPKLLHLRSALALTAIAALACGRSPSAAAPTTATPSPTVDPSAPATPPAPAVDERPAIAQVALDLPALQQYFHASEPGRVPVVVVTSAHVDPSWQLSKFGQAVLFVPANQIAGRPFVEFTRFEITGDQARVDLHYDVEGIRVWMVLVRSADGWQWRDGELSER